jgi:agmatine/peptidylarginine deiminase
VSSDSPYVTASAYGPGFAFVPATGVTYPASGENLVNSPISSACFSCHDTSAAKAHMVLNGGSIYEKRSITLTKTETCLICHGAASSTNISNATAPTIKAVHRWW